jgi:hypothetical protein
MPQQTAIKCPSCQRVIRSLAELTEVRTIGLVLKGKCTCGAWVPCAELWHRQPTISTISTTS